MIVDLTVLAMDCALAGANATPRAGNSDEPRRSPDSNGSIVSVTYLNGEPGAQLTLRRDEGGRRFGDTGSSGRRHGAPPMAPLGRNQPWPHTIQSRINWCQLRVHFEVIAM